MCICIYVGYTQKQTWRTNVYSYLCRLYPKINLAYECVLVSM